MKENWVHNLNVQCYLTVRWHPYIKINKSLNSPANLVVDSYLGILILHYSAVVITVHQSHLFHKWYVWNIATWCQISKPFISFRFLLIVRIVLARSGSPILLFWMRIRCFLLLAFDIFHSIRTKEEWGSFISIWLHKCLYVVHINGCIYKYRCYRFFGN